jgi:hypothetical protein
LRADDVLLQCRDLSVLLGEDGVNAGFLLYKSSFPSREFAFFGDYSGFMGFDRCEPVCNKSGLATEKLEAYIFSVSDTLKTSSRRSCCRSCAAGGLIAGCHRLEQLTDNPLYKTHVKIQHSFNDARQGLAIASR